MCFSFDNLKHNFLHSDNLKAEKSDELLTPLTEETESFALTVIVCQQAQKGWAPVSQKP